MNDIVHLGRRTGQLVMRIVKVDVTNPALDRRYPYRLELGELGMPPRYIVEMNGQDLADLHFDLTQHLARKAGAGPRRWDRR